MLPSQHDLRVVDDVEGEDDGSDTRVYKIQDPALYTKLQVNISKKTCMEKLQISIPKKTCRDKLQVSILKTKCGE
jgi:hypothetical protein